MGDGAKPSMAMIPPGSVPTGCPKIVGLGMLETPA